MQQGSKFDHEYVDISLDGVIHDCDYFVDEDWKLQSCSSSRQNKWKASVVCDNKENMPLCVTALKESDE